MHENNGKPEALLWIDFETTGVDRRKSLPLEIGMECTDMLGEQKFGSLSRIIRPDRLDLLSMSPVAFSMHTDNGLLFELMGGSVRNDSMVVVANAVEEFLDSLSQRFSLVPAGTNVDFDLDFLRRLNLNPDAWLTYRKYDMATIRRLVTVLGAPGSIPGRQRPAPGEILHRTRHQRLQGHARDTRRQDGRPQVRKTISHLADRLGDAMATLFTLLALLLIPHAVIRAIIGQALHQWTPITWLAIHTALTIAALATSLASYAIAALLAPPRPETYQ